MKQAFVSIFGVKTFIYSLNHGEMVAFLDVIFITIIDDIVNEIQFKHPEYVCFLIDDIEHHEREKIAISH